MLTFRQKCWSDYVQVHGSLGMAEWEQQRGEDCRCATSTQQIYRKRSKFKLFQHDAYVVPNMVLFGRPRQLQQITVRVRGNKGTHQYCGPNTVKHMICNHVTLSLRGNGCLPATLCCDSTNGVCP